MQWFNFLVYLLVVSLSATNFTWSNPYISCTELSGLEGGGRAAMGIRLKDVLLHGQMSPTAS